MKEGATKGEEGKGEERKGEEEGRRGCLQQESASGVPATYSLHFNELRCHARYR
jgi:hypothetical protein